MVGSHCRHLVVTQSTKRTLLLVASSRHINCMTLKVTARNHYKNTPMQYTEFIYVVKKTRTVQFLFYLNPKFQASSLLLGLYSLMCVGTVQKPRCWFFMMRLLCFTADPTEHHDIADKHPHIVDRMKRKLATYRASLVPAIHAPAEPKSNPKHFGGVWSPGWC